jgi:hypothetical protein
MAGQSFGLNKAGAARFENKVAVEIDLNVAG